MKVLNLAVLDALFRSLAYVAHRGGVQLTTKSCFCLRYRGIQAAYTSVHVTFQQGYSLWLRPFVVQPKGRVNIGPLFTRRKVFKGKL